MKKLLFTLSVTFITLLSFAQAPNLMNYQGVARNAVGNALPNQPIGLRLSILNAVGGAPVYSETRVVNTNAFGLFNVVLGSVNATNVTGTIGGVAWGVAGGAKFLQVEIDPLGGTNFTVAGTTQLVSVPYALNAAGAPPIGAAGGDLLGSTYPNPIIAPLAVTTGKLADASVTTIKIADLNVTTAKLADGAVTTIKITDQAVTTAKLADGSVTTPKIADLNVTTPKLADGAVTTIKLADGAVTAAKITFPLIKTQAEPANALVDMTNSATTGTIGAIRGINASQDANANGVAGVISSPSPGGFSTAIRGTNNGTGGLGIGVTGSQAGSGWGVYGNTPAGIGVYGLSTSGFGIYGQSTTGVSVYGIQPGNGTNSAGYFQNLNSGNTTPTVVVANNGTSTADNINSINTGFGRGGYFEVQNAASVANAIEATTNGTGASWGIRATSTGTNGSGLFIVNNATNASNNIQSQTNGIGRAGLFRTTNAANTATTLEAQQSGIGSGITVGLTNPSNGARGIDVSQAGVGPGVFATSAGGSGVWGITSSISAAGVIGDNTFGEAVVGRNRGGNGVGAVVGRNDSSGYGVRGFNTKDGIGVLGQSGISGGTGTAGRFENVNAANTTTTMAVATNGIGSGITIQLSNPSNGARGIDVNQSGVGPGVFATSAGGNALWGITSSISAAGVIGDNTFGEAVVGRNRGGNGVGAVVGRNDSSGYGVRGFNTKDGIGVLGQAGISGGTGIGGRFENVNAANPTPVLQAAGNGTGVTLLVSNSNGGATDLAIFQKGGVGNVARIDAAGKGFFNGGTQNSGADIAEAFDVIGNKDNYEAGDVLIISTDKDRAVEKSSGAYSTLVVGVYATKPGVLLTEENIDSKLEGKVPMGVIGVIPTKVCNEGGAIRRGDMLVTSSTPGVAMKADINKVRTGQVLGKALEDFDAASTGKIKVLVSVK